MPVFSCALCLSLSHHPDSPGGCFSVNFPETRLPRFASVFWPPCTSETLCIPICPVSPKMPFTYPFNPETLEDRVKAVGTSLLFPLVSSCFSPPLTTWTAQPRRAVLSGVQAWTVRGFPRDSVQLERFGRRAAQMICVPPVFALASSNHLAEMTTRLAQHKLHGPF